MILEHDSSSVAGDFLFCSQPRILIVVNRVVSENGRRRHPLYSYTSHLMRKRKEKRTGRVELAENLVNKSCG